MRLFSLEILADAMTSPDEEKRRLHQNAIKQKVAVLNSMLKKMIPLYDPQAARKVKPEPHHIKTEPMYHPQPQMNQVKKGLYCPTN